MFVNSSRVSLIRQLISHIIGQHSKYRTEPNIQTRRNLPMQITHIALSAAANILDPY